MMFPFTFSLPEKNAYKKQRRRKKKYSTVHPQNTKQEAKDRCDYSVLRRKPSVHNAHWIFNRKPSKFNFDSIQDDSFLSRVQDVVYHLGKETKYKATSLASTSFVRIAQKTSPGVKETSSQKLMAKLHKGRIKSSHSSPPYAVYIHISLYERRKWKAKVSY